MFKKFLQERPVRTVSRVALSSKKQSYLPSASLASSMDVKDIMKFQMLSGMNSPQQSGFHQNLNSNSTGGIDESPLGRLTNSPMFSMMAQCVMVAAMGVLEEGIKQLPMVVQSTKNMLYDRFIRERVTKTMDSMQSLIADKAIPLNKRHFMNTVTMTRWFKPPEKKGSESADLQESNEMVDAVLSMVAKLNNVPSLQLVDSARMMITHRESPIQLTEDIFVKLDKLDMSTDGSLERVRLVLMSNQRTASEITAYIRHVQDLHRQELKNALGDTIYFFDQKNKSDFMDPRGMPKPGNDDGGAKFSRIMNAPKELSFSRTPFHSNKRFDNTFGEQVREVEARVSFFCDNKNWYSERGIPYQLGIMLSGPPGCGKTSVLRAIANKTRRHIINVNFASITTATQLKNLLFSETIQSFANSTSTSEVQTLTIPIDQRLYVLEEIDAIGDIVKQRHEGMEKRDPIPDELTLAEILTALDGTVESPGRMLVMTSNHPEMLDAALIRPGRIDVSLVFTNASRDLQSELYDAFYRQTFPKRLIPKLPDMQLTPAEVGQVLFKHFMNPDPELITSELNRAAVDKTEKQKTRTQAQRLMKEREIREAKEKREREKEQKREREHHNSLSDDCSDSSSVTYSKKSKEWRFKGKNSSKNKKQTEPNEEESSFSDPETTIDEKKEDSQRVPSTSDPLWKGSSNDREDGENVDDNDNNNDSGMGNVVEFGIKRYTEMYNSFEGKRTESNVLAGESMGGSCYASACGNELVGNYTSLDEVY